MLHEIDKSPECSLIRAKYFNELSLLAYAYSTQIGIIVKNLNPLFRIEFIIIHGTEKRYAHKKAQVNE